MTPLEKFNTFINTPEFLSMIPVDQTLAVLDYFHDHTNYAAKLVDESHAQGEVLRAELKNAMGAGRKVSISTLVELREKHKKELDNAQRNLVEVNEASNAITKWLNLRATTHKNKYTG